MFSATSAIDLNVFAVGVKLAIPNERATAISAAADSDAIKTSLK